MSVDAAATPFSQRPFPVPAVAVDPGVQSVIAMLFGLVALVGGGELLVRGASRLAAAASIAPLVIGLTVVAFGTSAPELAVSVRSAWLGNGDLAVGNVVGSNIFNVLFILGCSAMIVPLSVSRELIRRDVPLVIAASILFWIFAASGSINRTESTVLATGIILYTIWCLRTARHKTSAERGLVKPGSSGLRHVATSVAIAVAGLVLLGLGSQWLVRGAVQIATAVGVSQLVIGLTIVAAGTSLPEVVTSLMAAIRGERDIAVGNVVGSNLFNILCVLGVSGIVSPTDIPVSQAARSFDLPVMTAVAIACLPIFSSGLAISRREGLLFVTWFVGYLAFTLTAATSDSVAPSFRAALWFAIPLITVGAISVVCGRGRSTPRTPKSGT